MFNFNKIASELEKSPYKIGLEKYKLEFKNIITKVFEKFTNNSEQSDVMADLFLMQNPGFEKDCFNYFGFYKYKEIKTKEFSESVQKVLHFGELLTKEINSYNFNCSPEKVISYLMEISQKEYV